MNSATKEKFTTGEFAKYFGIKKDTLFYYDKIDLFKPEIKDTNGYRYYTSKQLDMFWAIHSLRYLGMPIKQLKNYFSSPSLLMFEELATNQLSKIQKELKHLQDISFWLENLKSIVNEISMITYNHVYFEYQDEDFIIYSQKIKNSTTNNHYWLEAHNQFYKNLNINGPIQIGSLINLNDIKKGDYKKIDRLFIRMKKENATILPNGMYAIYYYQGPFENVETIYSSMINTIDKKGYEVKGDFFEEYLINSLYTNDENKYVTRISCPVKQKV